MRNKTLLGIGVLGFHRLNKGLNPTVKRVNHKEYGGTARLDAERPEPHEGFASFGRWFGFLVLLPGLPALLVHLGLGSYVVLPWNVTGWGLLWLAIAFGFAFVEGWHLLFAYRLAKFRAHQKSEASYGLSGYASSVVFSDTRLKLSLGVVLASFTVRILAAGIPGEFGEALNKAGTWLILFSWPASVYAGLRLGKLYIAAREAEYNRWKRHERDGTFAALGLKEVPADLHDRVEFEPGDGFVVSPVPPYIAPILKNVERNLAERGADDWTLDERSQAPGFFRIAPITMERLEDRQLQRDSNYLLVRRLEESVSDEEILKRELVIPEGSISPDATAPEPPQAVLIPADVNEKDFVQIQRFARDMDETEAMVSYDMERWNPQLRRHERVVYLQKVSDEHAAVVQQITDRVGKGRPGSVWAEIYSIPDTDENDHAIQRIDTVLIKQSPIKGVTEEECEKVWRPVIELIPGWKNGTITQIPGTDAVILRHAEPLALPAMVRTMDLLLPVTNTDPKAWAKNIYGLNPSGEPVIHDLISVPNLLIAGKPGTGKSAVARHIVAQRLTLGHKIIVLDHEKKAAFARPFKSKTLIWATDNRAIANAMAFAHEDALRKYKVIRKLGYENWYDATPEERETHGLYPVSIFFDEFENAIAPKDLRTTEAAFGKDSKRYESDQKFNAAIGLILDYGAKLGKVDRAAGTYLVIMTQFPYQEKLKDVRNALGMSIQLAATGTTLKSNEVGLAMGPDASEAIEILTKFTAPINGEGQVGVGVMQDAENGGLTAFKAPWLALDEVETFLTLAGVPDIQPWRITDQLGVGLRAEEEPDPRTPIEPPFGQSLSHLDEGEEEDVIDLYSGKMRELSEADESAVNEPATRDAVVAPAPPVNKSIKELFGFDLGE